MCEELLFERGITVSYAADEAVRLWCERFGPECAARLRRRQPRPGDRWHLDEVFLKINGRMRYLWRAVDQDGSVLDILVTDKRDTATARPPFRKLLKGTETVPRVIVTDRLRSYGAAHHQVMPSGGTPQLEVLEQQGRELTPARPAKGIRAAGLPQGRPGTEVPRRLQPDLPALPPPAATG